MKKLLFAVIVGALYSSASFAGEAKVGWGKLDDFSDVVVGSESKERFRERLIKEFEEVFSAMAKKLPDGYVLNIEVADLDLAGDARFVAWTDMYPIRVMEEIYWPRMNFAYTLKNAKEEIVVHGKEELRDMNYLRGFKFPSGATSFEYEEKMLQDWFKKQVLAGSFPSKDVRAVASTN